MQEITIRNMSNTSLLNELHLNNYNFHSINNIPSTNNTHNNMNMNMNMNMNNIPLSRNNSTISLDKYHEPSSIEKSNLLKKYNSSNLNLNLNLSITSTSSSLDNQQSLSSQLHSFNSFALPPISSFDNLVRAAERQYNSSTINNNNINININNVNSNSNSNLSNINPLLRREPLHKEIILKKNENANGAKKITGNKINKPRRKKQCPMCLNYYANLSTHKSTHLTPEDRPHRCTICNRGFARNNDLIRHQKRHWKENNQIDLNMSEHDKLMTLHKIKGTFKCPFNSTLIQLDMEMYPYKSRPLMFETSNCHQTGIFSRCDTYKNHLRALHFEYPPGTKKKDRNSTPGRCRNCGAKFNNADEWLNNHVGENCGYFYH